jgi:tetratricopeptide (TPR) repeat protein
MRFDKLEFPDDKSKPPGPKPAAEDRRDEQYWLAQANEHRRTGNYENALRFYSRALEVEKTLTVAWVGQVQMLVQLGEYPQADMWGRKALEFFPNQPELLAGRAQATCRLGDMKQAHELSDGAMQQRGDSAYCWMVRGELMVAGKQEMDRHCFDRAQLANGDWIVPLESALIYLHYRSPSKALPRAQLAVQAESNAYYAWFILGRCQQDLGFIDSARQSYERCLELCPRHEGAGVRIANLGQGSWTATMRRWLGRG